MADSTSAFLQGLFGNTDSVASGSDISNLSRTIAADDPYRMAAGPLAAAKFNTSTWSPTTTAGVTAAQAFLASALNQIGLQNEGAQVQKVASVLPQLFKDPSSVGAPDGVDPLAFSQLKMSAMNKKEQTDEAIRQALAIKGMTVNQDGSVSATPGATDAIQAIFSAENAGKQKAAGLSSRNSKIITDLSGTISAIAALNHHEALIKQLPGGDGLVGGVENWGDKFIPGSTAYQYTKALPFLADPLTVGLSGTSRQGTLNKTIDALSLGFGQDQSSLLDITGQAKQAMIDKGSKLLDTLGAANMLPDGELQSWKDKLGAAATGTLVDNSYLARQPAAGSSVDPSSMAQMQAEAQTLAAQGLTQPQVAAALRAKYGGG